MPQNVALVLTPRQAADAKYYTSLAARRLGVPEHDIALVRVVKRSIDARQRQPKVNLTLEVYVDREPQPAPVHFDYPDVSGHTEVVVVGPGRAFRGAAADRAGAEARYPGAGARRFSAQGRHCADQPQRGGRSRFELRFRRGRCGDFLGRQTLHTQQEAR